jgi:hypothetical protein
MRTLLQGRRTRTKMHCSLTSRRSLARHRLIAGFSWPLASFSSRCLRRPSAMFFAQTFRGGVQRCAGSHTSPRSMRPCWQIQLFCVPTRGRPPAFPAHKELASRAVNAVFSRRAVCWFSSVARAGLPLWQTPGPTAGESFAATPLVACSLAHVIELCSASRSSKVQS